jgi:hypothetical protein
MADLVFSGKILCLKMKDAFPSRLLVYGYLASNPEMASVPILSQFLGVVKSLLGFNDLNLGQVVRHERCWRGV